MSQYIKERVLLFWMFTMMRFQNNVYYLLPILHFIEEIFFRILAFTIILDFTIVVLKR